MKAYVHAFVTSALCEASGTNRGPTTLHPSEITRAANWTRSWVGRRAAEKREVPAPAENRTKIPIRTIRSIAIILTEPCRLKPIDYKLIYLLLLPCAELPLLLIVLAFSPTSFHFSRSWTQAVQFFYLHLANVLFDVILPSVLGSSL